MIQSIEVSRTRISRMNMLNFCSMIDASIAQERLSVVYCEITIALNDLDKSDQRRG